MAHLNAELNLKVSLPSTKILPNLSLIYYKTIFVLKTRRRKPFINNASFYLPAGMISDLGGGMMSGCMPGSDIMGTGRPGRPGFDQMIDDGSHQRLVTGEQGCP